MSKRSFKRTAGALSVAAAALAAVPAGASAAPSHALVSAAGGGDTPQPRKSMIVHVVPTSADLGGNLGRTITVAYRDGAWVLTDNRGIVPDPSGGGTCVSTTPTEVRCPADLSDPLITESDVYVTTGQGNDVIDFRGVPDLPGHAPAGSPNGSSFRDARPVFFTRAGKDLVLAGDFGSEGNLGKGADRLIGGAGDDGAGYRFEGGITGGAGPDRMIGNGGNDWFNGNAGADYLAGGEGRDILVGGKGNDRLNSRDGEVDWITCGAGNPKKQSIKRDRIDKPAKKKGKKLPINCRR